MESQLYSMLKPIHLACALTTFCLFFLRGVWMIRGSARLRARWVRVLPHAVDALLLASAVGLMFLLRQFPGSHDWLTAKVLAVLLYIGLGLVAFRFARRAATRIAAWLGAQLTFFYIVLVAWQHRPLPL